ncbi:unnamed protein product [Schistosoma margrebowiei]|uniref:Uncharacterized protein n=1 Tax=Schistosoma margrebowiei TaxID=48269 RepID=A0A183MG88_9TREM|nr:unnamed protein product [Schistosoma margrebowiei]
MKTSTFGGKREIQFSTQNTSNLLIRHYQQQQQPTVLENKPDPNGGRNQEEAQEFMSPQLWRLDPHQDGEVLSWALLYD